MPSRLILLVAAVALSGAACATASGVDPTEPPATNITSTSAAPTTAESSATETTAAEPTTTAAPTTTPSTAATLPPVASLPPDTTTCAIFGQVATVGTVAEPELTEISGIAASRRHEGVIWAHNDSGGAAAVYALAADGTALGRFDLDGAAALDWEDIAMGPGPDTATDYLYVGDIGDNLAFRPEAIVLRIAEPDPTSGGGAVGGVERFGLVYPVPGVNAEAMAVDPVTGDILIVGKEPTGVAGVYWAPSGELTAGGLTALRQIATLDLGAEVSAADISAAGDMVAFRGYREIWVWPRFDLDLGVTLAATPCMAASPDEVQGEALTFDPAGLGLYTISEGSAPAINLVSGRG